MNWVQILLPFWYGPPSLCGCFPGITCNSLNKPLSVLDLRILILLLTFPAFLQILNTALWQFLQPQLPCVHIYHQFSPVCGQQVKQGQLWQPPQCLCSQIVTSGLGPSWIPVIHCLPSRYPGSQNPGEDEGLRDFPSWLWTASATTSSWVSVTDPASLPFPAWTQRLSEGTAVPSHCSSVQSGAPSHGDTSLSFPNSLQAAVAISWWMRAVLSDSQWV